LRAFKAQVALVTALDQVADTGRFKCSCEWLPDAVVGGDLSAIHRQSKIWIRPQKGGDLLCFRFVDAQLVRLQRGIILLEALAHLFPGQSLLGRGRCGADAGDSQCGQQNETVKPVHQGLLPAHRGNKNAQARLSA
jgi:hypothetical protein